jgi:hypothetical protein
MHLIAGTQATAGIPLTARTLAAEGPPYALGEADLQRQGQGNIGDIAECKCVTYSLFYLQKINSNPGSCVPANFARKKARS